MGSKAILLLLGILLLSNELLAQQRGICYLPPDEGPCKGSMVYYYYDTYLGYCRRFFYGGCRGNANRFKTRKACIHSCVDYDNCSLAPDEGPCMGAMTYYYYDTAEETCKPFTYGGCRGNENRFKTENACKLACRKLGRKK